MLSFINTQLEHLSKIKPDFETILSDVIEERHEFDINRIFNLIKMKVAQINDKVG